MTLIRYVLRDIKEGVKVILTNHYWYKRYMMAIDDNCFQRFTLKQDWIEQPLEGEATYIGKVQVVCSKAKSARIYQQFFIFSS